MQPRQNKKKDANTGTRTHNVDVIHKNYLMHKLYIL